MKISMLIILFLLILPSIIWAKLPVVEKSVSITESRAVVEYQINASVTDFNVNIYPLNNTRILKKVLIGVSKIKNSSETVRIEVIVDQRSSSRPAVGVEFSGVIDNQKRASVRSIDFSKDRSRTEKTKEIKIDQDGKQLRVMPIKEG